MLDSKLHGRHPWPGVELVERVVVVALLQEREVGGLREVGLVVEQVEDADRLLGQHVEDRLVVGEVDWGPFDLLLGILGLEIRETLFSEANKNNWG